MSAFMPIGWLRILVREAALLMLGWTVALSVLPWGAPLADGPPERAGSWTAYFGTHYDDRPWAGTIREPGGPRLHRYGLASGGGQDETGSIARQAAAVATLRAVSQDVLGDPAAASIVLGSAANAYNPNSRAWLDALLDYRIRGEYAPALAGRTVAEVVDVVAIHYLVTSEPSGWDAALAEIYSRWVGSGRIRGIWATEELGRQRAAAGRGAITALRVVSRCLSWAARNRVSPSQLRCIFWGSSLGLPETRGDDGMQMLFDFLAGRPVSTVSLLGRHSSTGDAEVYAFGAADVGRYVIIMHPSPDAGALEADADARPIRFDVSSSWPTGIARGYRFSPDGITAVDVARMRMGDSFVLTLNPGVRFRSNEALVIFADADASPGYVSLPSALFSLSAGVEASIPAWGLW